MTASKHSLEKPFFFKKNKIKLSFLALFWCMAHIQEPAQLPKIWSVPNKGSLFWCFFTHSSDGISQPPNRFEVLNDVISLFLYKIFEVLNDVLSLFLQNRNQSEFDNLKGMKKILLNIPFCQIDLKSVFHLLSPESCSGKNKND